MTTKLYNTDFAQWAIAQASHLRNEEYAELDLPNLIEEIEDMARRHRDELHKRLMRILEHLLKITCEPESKALGKWRKTIVTQRTNLRHMLKENATLRASVPDFVPDAYQDARELAAAGTRCTVDSFPVDCPWTADQILDKDWLPG